MEAISDIYLNYTFACDEFSACLTGFQSDFVTMQLLYNLKMGEQRIRVGTPLITIMVYHNITVGELGSIMHLFSASNGL